MTNTGNKPTTSLGIIREATKLSPSLGSIIDSVFTLFNARLTRVNQRLDALEAEITTAEGDLESTNYVQWRDLSGAVHEIIDDRIPDIKEEVSVSSSPSPIHKLSDEYIVSGWIMDSGERCLREYGSRQTVPQLSVKELTYFLDYKSSQSIYAFHKEGLLRIVNGQVQGRDIYDFMVRVYNSRPQMWKFRDRVRKKTNTYVVSNRIKEVVKSVSSPPPIEIQPAVGWCHKRDFCLANLRYIKHKNTRDFLRNIKNKKSISPKQRDWLDTTYDSIVMYVSTLKAKSRNNF